MATSFSAGRTTDHGQATGKLYHLPMQVECTFCNLLSRAPIRAVMVIALYELLGNQTTKLIESPRPSYHVCVQVLLHST